MLAKDRLFPPVRLWAAGLMGLLLVGTPVLAQLAPAPLPDVPARPAPGAKVIVADVKVQGTHNTPAERVLNTALTKPGMEYNQATIDEDVRRIYGTGLFAHVSVKTVERPENRNAVDVYFIVAERPQTIKDIVYNGGQHLKLDELKNITHLRLGDPVVPYLNQEACRAIVAKLYEDGRPFATCKLVEGDKPSDNRIVFDITEGPVVKVKHVDFVGQTFVSGEVLRQHIKTSREFLGLVGGKLNLFMVDYDVEELEKYYKSYGFHDAKVSRELAWEADGKHVDLIFHVSEGTRYRVSGRPQVDGAGKELPQEVVQAIPRLAPGEFYDESKVKADVRNITDYYGMTGRDVRVKEEPYFNPETPGVCQVHYQIMERPPAKVGQIYIVGNEVTRQSVILRELPDGLLPGQILQYPDLRIAERNLIKRNIFENNGETGVHPTVEVLNREGDEEYKDLLVRVQETKTGSLMFGVGVNSDLGLNGSIVLNERNFDITRFPTSFDDFMAGRAFRGAGQELRIEAVPGTTLQRYSATWVDPRLFDSLYSLSVALYYRDVAYDEYNESRLGTRVTVGRKLNQYWSASATVRIENVGVHDVVAWDPYPYQNAEGNNFLIGAGVGLTRDTRDSYLRATEGNILSLSFEQVSGDLPSQSPIVTTKKSWTSYPSATVDFSQYWTVYQRADNSGRHVLAYHGQMSWEGSDAPVFETYFAGGFRSMRGFQFRGISPQINGVPVGGDFMMLNSLEYQIPLMANDKIWFVTFCDTGTVEPRMELKDYRVSVGAGVRFMIPGMGPVPIALDFGFPVVKGPGDKEQVFSFWLGFFH
jgi:outer membrane protein assembly complex protein YaeT